MSLVEEEETVKLSQVFLLLFYFVLFLSDETPSWKSASLSLVSVHCFLYDLVQAVLIPWAFFELTNSGFFLSCENWDGVFQASEVSGMASEYSLHGFIVII